MPLLARLGDEDIIAPFVDADRWVNLKGKVPRPVLRCGAEAVVKTSHRGTQFFAHHRTPTDDNHKGESAEHLAVKTAVLRAAQTLGWDGVPEFPADDRQWIADVMLSKGARRVAIEVQMSGQTADEYVYRQGRYAAEGIECIWLVRRNDERLIEVPSVQVHFRKDPMTVVAGPRHVNEALLTAFLGELLEGELRWRERGIGNVTASVTWGAHQCYRCSELSIVYRKGDHTVASCPRCERATWHDAFRTANVAPIKAATALGLHLPMAKPGRYQTLRRKQEHGLGCPSCGSYFYPAHLEWLGTDDAIYTTATTASTSVQAHWCQPGEAIDSVEQVVRYTSGERTPPRGSRTAEKLIAEARLREDARRQQRAAQKSQQERHEQLQKDALAWKAQQASRPNHSDLPWPVGQRGAPAGALNRQAEGPLPQPEGPSPSNPHERTAAIDGYTQKHLRHVDELLELFPVMDEECTCHTCVTICRSFSKSQRKYLWPGRGHGSSTSWVSV